MSGPVHPSRGLLIVLAAALLAVTVVMALRSDDSERRESQGRLQAGDPPQPAAGQVDAGQPDAGQPVALPVVGELAAVPAPAPGDDGGVKTHADTSFPDGSKRPALNGVTMDLALNWPNARPYSPVVAVVSKDGVDFWQHEDGSFSTTLVRVETISGKTLQFAQTYTPGPAPTSMTLQR